MKSEILVRVSAASAKMAFDEAKAADDQLRHRQRFRMVSVPSGKDPMQHVHDLLDDPELFPYLEEDASPLGCISLGGNEFVFFGVQGCKR